MRSDVPLSPSYTEFQMDELKRSRTGRPPATKMGPVLLLLLLLLAGTGRAQKSLPPPVPTDCTSVPFESGDGGGLSLTCSLSAINSENEQTNFSVVPSTHTMALTVVCRDGGVMGRLERDGFRSLLHLRKLTLDGCALEELPPRAFWGLDKLRTLKIRTRSGSGRPLRVSSDAFLGLDALEELDLSQNSVRGLDRNSLCPLGSKLRTLNLSKNDLSSLSDLASGGLSCLRSLRSLDLGFNRLSASDGGLANLEGLEELRLNNNHLRNLKGDALVEKSRLQFVDLSNNNLASLPEEVFAGAADLKRISLANNSLSFLPGGLFRPLARSLEVLDLSGNLMTSLSPPLVTGLQLLTSLDLGHNKLVSVDSSSALRGLSSLRSLKLNDNKLTRLPVLPLPALTSLVLSRNSLTGRLSPGRVFSRTPALSHLLLDDNQLDDLPRQVFANASGLTVLDLSKNRFRGDVPDPVRNLRKLQSVALSHNHLDALTGLRLPALWRLQAAGNKLSNVTKAQFEGLPALQVLDLSQNSIAGIEKGAFDGNRPLQALRLDDNQLARMEGLFHGLPNLSWLNVSANRISVFDLAMVPKQLQWLDLHQNRIHSLENYFAVESDSGIAHLDASFNLIEELGPQNVPDGVETLLLNDNRIETVVPYTFFKKSKLRKVDLSVNRLESIDRNALRLSSGNGDQDKPTASALAVSPVPPRSQPKFYLGGNPIKCDCHMAWFKTVNNVDAGSLQNFPYVADLESIYCQLLYSRDKAFMPLVDARTEDFLCSYKTHCFALCHCCDYDACDCEMTCPGNCTCYHDTTWTKNIAECSSADFQDLPDQLPMDATEIFLDGNNVGELHSHTFIGRKNLKVLYLNNSKIFAVENHTFNGLSVLEELHLEDNSISKLQGDEFHGLGLLRELHLQDNRIATVNNATFRNLKSLRVLDLSGNLISDFPVWQLALNPLVSRVSLGGNPWSCECRFLASYRQWLDRFRRKVPDARSVNCVQRDSTEIAILDGDFAGSLDCAPPPPSPQPAPPAKEEVSKRIHGRDDDRRALLPAVVTDGGVGNSEKKVSTSEEGGGDDVFHEFLPIFLGVIAAFVLVVVVMIAAFAYRDEARLWIYSKYGVRFFHRVDGGGAAGAAADADRMFDAFVAYSAKDDAFVRQMLAQELELPPVPPPPDGGLLDHHHYASHTLQQHLSGQYKLCLFYRDLPVHQSPYHLSDTVVQASEASRRTIVVLSDHFVKAEWSRFDFKSGLHQALHTCTGRTHRRGPRRLIVILLGDVASRRDLDPDLRLYLKSAVVIQWGDRLFWEKLRYAMPDVRRPAAAAPSAVGSSKRQLSQMSQLSQMTEAFSPDNSFRYETYRPPIQPGHHSSTLHHHHNGNGGLIHHSTSTQSRSLGGGSGSSGGGTYQSVGTPDEQDSTRTMTIHI